MRVINVSAESLVPYANNARIHSEEQIQQIANSIREFGFTNPILIKPDKTVIAGHGRLLAAKEIGMPHVPCIVLDNLTDEQCRALVIADNKLAENARWNFELLAQELQDLKDIDFDLSVTGFSEKEMDKLFENLEEKPETKEDEFDIDKTADDITEPITQKGDIWKLGNHRLMCGDSTNISDVKKLIGKARGKILFTSPPYSDMRLYNGNKNLSIGHLKKFIPAYKNFTDYQVVNFGLQRKEYEIVEYWDDYIKEARDNGYKLLAWNVWDRGSCGSIGNQSAFFPIRHEWIFVFGTKYFELNFTAPKKDRSINEKRTMATRRKKDGSMELSSRGNFARLYKKTESVVTIGYENTSIRSEHPAVFPVALPAEYIKSMTDEYDAVIEPFGGSGTTLIACEQLNRKCLAMELDSLYCDVIIRRWENLTGKQAVLKGK